MIFNEYETVVIIRPDLDDSVTYAIIEKLESVIASNEGNLLDRDDWGKRKMAYAIRNHLKGHYCLLRHASPADLVDELERRIRIEDDVIRFLTVKQDDDVDVEALRLSHAELRRVREEEAAERARQAAEAAALEEQYANERRSSDDDDDDNDDNDDSDE